MTGFQQWLATLPTTNLQIFVGVCLGIVAAFVLLTALLLHNHIGDLQEGVVDSLLIFIGSMIGLSVAQFTVKRATTKPEIMNAQAAIDANTAVRTSTTETTTKTTETVPSLGVEA